MDIAGASRRAHARSVSEKAAEVSCSSYSEEGFGVRRRRDMGSSASAGFAAGSASASSGFAAGSASEFSAGFAAGSNSMRLGRPGERNCAGNDQEGDALALCVVKKVMHDQMEAAIRMKRRHVGHVSDCIGNECMFMYRTLRLCTAVTPLEEALSVIFASARSDCMFVMLEFVARNYEQSIFQDCYVLVAFALSPHEVFDHLMNLLFSMFLCFRCLACAAGVVCQPWPHTACDTRFVWLMCICVSDCLGPFCLAAAL